MRSFSAYVALLVAAVASAPAGALEFRSIADELAVLYDGPSKDSTKRLILKKGYPVEVIITSGNWMRVRDHVGQFWWIESGRLASKRMVMVAVSGVRAVEAPDTSARPIANAEKGQLLELVGVSGGWAKVRSSDGTEAFIRLGDLWGV